MLRGRGLCFLCLSWEAFFKNRDILINNTLFASLLSRSVVDPWLSQNVQTVDFLLVGRITTQFLDLLNTWDKGINLVSQPAL